MKVDATGVHIKGPHNIIVQHSQSQQNALAILDEDGVWVHLDVNAISVLYHFLYTPVVNNAPLYKQEYADTTDKMTAKNLFEENFKNP